MSRLWLVLALGAACLVAPGCKDDDDSSSGSEAGSGGSGGSGGSASVARCEDVESICDACSLTALSCHAALDACAAAGDEAAQLECCQAVADGWRTCPENSGGAAGTGGNPNATGGAGSGGAAGTGENAGGSSAGSAGAPAHAGTAGAGGSSSGACPSTEPTSGEGCGVEYLGEVCEYASGMTCNCAGHAGGINWLCYSCPEARPEPDSDCTGSDADLCAYAEGDCRCIFDRWDCD